jgi:hypothetical protein
VLTACLIVVNRACLRWQSTRQRGDEERVELAGEWASELIGVTPANEIVRAYEEWLKTSPRYFPLPSDLAETWRKARQAVYASAEPERPLNDEEKALLCDIADIYIGGAQPWLPEAERIINAAAPYRAYVTALRASGGLHDSWRRFKPEAIAA